MFSYHNNKLLIHVGMSDTLAAPELRGTEGMSMTDDYHYYAIKGRYDPGVKEPHPGPSDEFIRKLKKLK